MRNPQSRYFSLLCATFMFSAILTSAPQTFAQATYAPEEAGGGGESAPDPIVIDFTAGLDNPGPEFTFPARPQDNEPGVDPDTGGIIVYGPPSLAVTTLMELFPKYDGDKAFECIEAGPGYFSYSTGYQHNDEGLGSFGGRFKHTLSGGSDEGLTYSFSLCFTL